MKKENSKLSPRKYELRRSYHTKFSQLIHKEMRISCQEFSWRQRVILSSNSRLFDRLESVKLFDNSNKNLDKKFSPLITDQVYCYSSQS